MRSSCHLSQVLSGVQNQLSVASWKRYGALESCHSLLKLGMQEHMNKVRECSEPLLRACAMIFLQTLMGLDVSHD
jgi:hypothetical protein